MCCPISARSARSTTWPTASTFPMNQISQDLTVCGAYLVGSVRHRLLLPADARGGQMTERTSFYRKLAYSAGDRRAGVSASCWLACRRRRPTTRGGKLAQLRNEYQASRSGRTSAKSTRPAKRSSWRRSGLRGVAVNLLWEKANYYKKVEDWTNLTATLEQLAKLQPNFITFWKFQAWNLTYNVSVEFDDYHDRYYYVRRGIEFLQGRRALQQRQSAAAVGPGLVHRPEDRPGGRVCAVSPAVQGRMMTSTRADRTPDERDNWLVGKEWYLKAIDAVDNKGKSLGRKSPRISIPARPSRR